MASQDVGCFLRLSKTLSHSAAVLMHTAQGRLGTAETTDVSLVPQVESLSYSRHYPYTVMVFTFLS